MKLKPDYSSMTVLRVSLRKSNVLRVIMPFILTMFILFWNINPLLSSELYSRDKVRKIRLVYGLTVSNRGDHAIQNVTVRIPIIQDHLPYQTATITSITPSVFSREKRGKGSSTARFLIDRIAPDEKKAFLICADVEISEVTYNVQEKKAVNSDASMRQYLLPDGCFGTKSPALREKCREFSHERNPLKKALKIYEYLISGTFSFSNSPVSSGVDPGFDKKHLNCSDAAALYLVMCRQCGIPARYVGGVFYTSERKWYPLLHAWVEIYIPPFGWLPVDPTLGRLSEKNRTLCFAHIRNRYIALWNTQFSAFSVEASSNLDNLEIHNGVFAESY